MFIDMYVHYTTDFINDVILAHAFNMSTRKITVWSKSKISKVKIIAGDELKGFSTGRQVYSSWFQLTILSLASLSDFDYDSPFEYRHRLRTVNMPKSFLRNLCEFLRRYSG